LLTSPVDIFTAYFNAAQHYAPLITPYALRVWFSLTLIELITISLTWMMGSDDPPEILWKLVRWIFLAGFAYWWITNSWTLGLTVLGSFNQLGVDLTGQPNLAPMAFIHTATSLAKMLFAAPSTGRLIPNIALAIADFFLSGLIYLIFVILAALAIFTVIGAYIILAAGDIIVAFLPCRFTSQIVDGYFTWLVKTGVVIFFFYLMLGIAQQLVAQWLTTITGICKPAAVYLPSPLLGTPPAPASSVPCTAPIPTNILLELLADTVVLAIICGLTPFAAGAIVSHGVNAALEHFAVAKYLAGSGLRPIGRAISGGYQVYRMARTTNQSSLEQRLAAGAQAAARVTSSQQQTTRFPQPPPINAFGVQRTQGFPNNSAKETSKI
jgi:P-type conjugative transfer protein TrbL